MVEGDVNFEITVLAHRVPASCPTAFNILRNVLILYLSVSPPGTFEI